MVFNSALKWYKVFEWATPTKKKQKNSNNMESPTLQVLEVDLYPEGPIQGGLIQSEYFFCLQVDGPNNREGL